MSNPGALRIVHCVRSPVGGIFRHVRDLADSQSAAGHAVGILCDSSTGGPFEDAIIEEIRPRLALGVVRIPMRRAITPGDMWTLWKAYREIAQLKPDVLHSHGAKGGAYARAIGTMLRMGGRRVARLYCPHGGSIHYDPSLTSSKVYFATERLLERMTDRLIFVSRYEEEGYRSKVGQPRCATTLVYNGLRPEEFEPVEDRPDAADFGYIGMMRDLKGTDVVIDAIALIRDRDGRQVTANFYGDGPDKPAYVERVRSLGLDTQIRFHEPTPAREAFATARVLVIPSRAESMPYIVLESIAASRPIVATRVGGIPEIFADEVDTLVTPGDPAALADAMLGTLDDPDRREKASARKNRLADRFSLETMAATIEKAYRDSLR